MDKNELFRFNVFVWRRRRRVNLLEEDKVMRRGDQVLTNLIFDLPQGCHVLPASVSICGQMLDLGDTLLLFALLWMALCGSRLLPQMYGTIYSGEYSPVFNNL